MTESRPFSPAAWGSFTRPMGPRLRLWDTSSTGMFRGGVSPSMLALLLAASALAHPSAHAAPPNRSVEQRLSLVEARQMLESQALWGIQATMPGDALKAIANIDLHMAKDQEQEERVRALQSQVLLLEQRLASIELALQDRGLGEQAPVRVTPPALGATTPSSPVPVVSQPLVLHGKQSKKAAQTARGKQGPKAKAARWAER